MKQIQHTLAGAPGYLLALAAALSPIAYGAMKLLAWLEAARGGVS